jgi:hypothetical protein
MMAREEENQSSLKDTRREHPLRERVGVCIEGMSPLDVITRIREAERAGVSQVWMTAGAAGEGSPDPLTLFAAAASQTEQMMPDVGATLLTVNAQNQHKTDVSHFISYSLSCQEMSSDEYSKVP